MNIIAPNTPDAHIIQQLPVSLSPPAGLAFQQGGTDCSMIFVFRRCPTTPQFVHFGSLLGFFGMSPLSGTRARRALVSSLSANALKVGVFACPYRIARSLISINHFLFQFFAFRSSYGGLSLLLVGELTTPLDFQWRSLLRHCPNH